MDSAQFMMLNYKCYLWTSQIIDLLQPRCQTRRFVQCTICASLCRQMHAGKYSRLPSLIDFLMTYFINFQIQPFSPIRLCPGEETEIKQR